MTLPLAWLISMAVDGGERRWSLEWLSRQFVVVNELWWWWLLAIDDRRELVSLLELLIVCRRVSRVTWTGSLRHVLVPVLLRLSITAEILYVPSRAWNSVLTISLRWTWSFVWFGLERGITDEARLLAVVVALADGWLKFDVSVRAIESTDERRNPMTNFRREELHLIDWSTLREIRSNIQLHAFSFLLVSFHDINFSRSPSCFFFLFCGISIGEKQNPIEKKIFFLSNWIFFLSLILSREE